jgi:hypothetical protein
MVTKEYWWAGADGKPFKNTRWARSLTGSRADQMGWLQAQEKLLERSSLSREVAVSADGSGCKST